MKKLLLLALAVTFSLTSCEKDVLDVNFKTNLSATSPQIDVNDTPTVVGTFATTTAYSQTFEVDLSNSDTQDYLDRLKDVSLSDVRLQFSGLTALAQNNIETDLKITFNNQISFLYTDFKYSNVANGQDFAITDTQKIAQIAEIFLNEKKVTIKVEGFIPDTAAYHFFIKFLAKANIKAKAL